jgi:hypothetical protein
VLSTQGGAIVRHRGGVDDESGEKSSALVKHPGDEFTDREVEVTSGACGQNISLGFYGSGIGGRGTRLCLFLWCFDNYVW